MGSVEREIYESLDHCKVILSIKVLGYPNNVLKNNNSSITAHKTLTKSGTWYELQNHVK